MDIDEATLRARYKCTASENGGWCDGVKRGCAMRCPAASLTEARERVCSFGIAEGLHAPFDEQPNYL